VTDDAARSAGGTLGNYAYRESGGERSVSEVIKDIFGNVQEMVRGEFRLARAEMRIEVGHTVNSAKLLAIGGVLALFATAFALVTIMLGLALFMPAWAAGLVMTLLLGLPGAALLLKGKEQIKMPVPQRTIDNVRENVEWMKSQTRS